MEIARLALEWSVVLAVLYQLWRVPRLWAFLYLFIVIFPKVALAEVPGQTTPIRVDDIVMAVVLGGWVLVQLLGRPRPAPPSPVTGFFLLYAIVATVTSLLGIASGTTTVPSFGLHMMRRVEYALLYYFFFRSIGTDELDDVVGVVRFSLLIIVSIWIVQIWTVAPGIGLYVDWSNPMPSFSASYDFGGYLMLATLLLYALWSTGANRSVGTALGLAGGVCLLLFAADSRSSMVGLAFAIVLDLFLRLKWQIVVAMVAAGASAPFLVNTEKMERTLNIITAVFTSLDVDAAQNAFVNDPSIRMRLRNWTLAIDRWSEHPFAGEGLGSYLTYTEQYNQPGTPDGWYVRVLAESGLLGLLAFMLLVGALLWALFRAYVQETRLLPRAIVYGAALGVIAMLVNAFLIDSFVSYKIMGVFWMIVGVGTRVAVEGRAPSAVPDSAGGAVGSPSPDPTPA